MPQPSFDLRGEVIPHQRTDLTQIDGINIMNPQTIIAEVGIDMSVFPARPHLRPFWAYVRTIRLPEARCSAEARSMSENRCATALRMAATSLWRSKTYLGAKFRRFASPSGCTKSHHGDGPTCSPASSTVCCAMENSTSTRG